MKRLFVGIPVSDEIKLSVSSLLKELEYFNVSVVSLQNLHFTLHFLGNVNEKKIGLIKEILFKIASEQDSFDINLKNVGVFPNDKLIRVVWINVQKNSFLLSSLMQKVQKELCFIHKGDYEAVPHLTLARVKMVNKEKFLKLLMNFNEREFGSMNVNKIVLFESVLSTNGVKYKVVEEFEF